MTPHRSTTISNFGNEYGKCFYLEKVPSLLLQSENGPRIAVTRMTRPTGMPEPTAPVRPEPSFNVVVHLRASTNPAWGTWVDGRFFPTPVWEQGGVGTYDLQSNPIALRCSPFDAVHFNLPRATLNEFAAENEMRPIESLSFTQGKRNDFLFQLTQFILPWLGDEMRISHLTFDYFALMFCSHVTSVYGSVRSLPANGAARLAPWQMRRVTELIENGLGGELRLPALARQCGLSTSHFSRSFKKSFGVPVHRFVIERRVERAKLLMKTSTMPLTEIALQSGFSDQASFCRTFGALVGTPPRRWMSEYRHSCRQ